MTRRRRIFAAVLAALAALVVLSSSVFIIKHTNHDCAGEDCPICAQLYACSQNLKTLAAAGLFALASAVFAPAARVQCCARASGHALRTPVSLRVKLSN